MRTTVKAIVAAAILLSVYLSTFSQQVAKSIPNSTSPDGIIGFLEFKPSDYGTQKHPLIIFLHGIGERGNGTSQINAVANNAIPLFCARGATMRFTVGGQTSSFVVLSPQLSTQYGYWPTFYVKEMIKYAKANLQIDPDRIYITGLSLGGGGTWRAITETNTENFDYTFDAGIAAAAPVCGTQEMNDGYFCKTVGDNHLPIWAFHSMDDGTVGVGTTQHGEIISKNCGVTPASIFTYYQSGGHSGAWINAYDTGHITRTVSGGGSFTANPNLYEWLLSNKRSTGQTPPAYTAPIANAGSAQTLTLPLNTITLAGSGTGTNGATISSYSWTKTSGPSPGSVSTPNAAATSVTGLVQGTYVFTLTVTDNHGLTSSSNVTITVNNTAAVSGQPIGYIKTSAGPYQACADASSAGRIPVYSTGIANGNLLYLDAAHTKIFDGGWNWYSFTPSLGGTVTQAFAVYPNGSVNLLTSCTSSTPPATQPSASPSGNTLLGYIKISTGAYQACADASSTGRTAIYGISIANGSYLYTDAALTQKYNGGWNWFSFTPVLGGPTTDAFGVYPIGGILLLRSCANGGARIAATSATTVEQDEATLKTLKDAGMAADAAVKESNKLIMYPNPVSASATIELYSEGNGIKTIYIYNSNSVLAARYIWQTVKGKNVFSLKNISALTNGLYVIDIRDYNGKSNGTLKFLKIN